MNPLLLATLLLPALAEDAAPTPTPETTPEPAAAPDIVAEAEVVLFEIDAHTTGVYIPDHRAPLVDVWVQVPVGQWDEGLMDSGGLEAWTNQFDDPAATLRSRADERAMQLAAGLRTGRSILYLGCLAEDLPEAKTLLGDIFANRAYDEAQFKRDAKSNEKSWELEQKDPASVRDRAVMALSFSETDPRQLEPTPYALPVRDSDTLAQLRDRMLQTPGRYVAFAGDLTIEQARDFATGLLPPADPSITWTEMPVEPLRERPDRHVVPLANTNQAYLDYFQMGPSTSDQHYPAWLVAQHVLGGHFFSRISVALRHDGGDTYSASAYSNVDNPSTPAGIVTFTRADNLDATEKKVKDTLATFHAEGITAQELDEAVRYFRGKALMRTQTPEQLLTRTMYNLGNDKPLAWHVNDPAPMAQLTLEDVNAVIREHFDPADFTMVVVVPE